MAPEWFRRNALQATGSALLATLAGCSSLGFDSQPKTRVSLGTTAYDVVIDGQPTIEDGVPTVWGLIIGHPDTARKLIDWGALTPREGDDGPGAEFRSFDPTDHFMSIVVGVLPTGGGLTGYSEESETIVEDIADDFTERPVFENGQLRYEVTSYRAFTPESDDPEYHYDYTFTLWRLDGNDRPDEIAIGYHDS